MIASSQAAEPRAVLPGAESQDVSGQEFDSLLESLGLEIGRDTYLQDPLFLLVFPVGILLWLAASGRRPRAAVGALGGAALPRTLRQHLEFLAPLCAMAGLALLTIALARPLQANNSRTDVSEGVDILCVLDRSSSMQHEDLEPGRSRLAVVKDVVDDFATRRMNDREGAADAVGLLAFARYPELRCPQTLDSDALTGFLADVQRVNRRAEDGTAIGRALAKSVALLADSDAKSRVVVLLTDGENTVDDITPIEAAKLAAERKVRVYTILAGRYQYVNTGFGIQAIDAELDESELRAIAETTGGTFFRARDRQDLEAIYADIEKLERTPREHLRSVETQELYAPWLIGGLLAYALAWLLRTAWLGRLV